MPLDALVAIALACLTAIGTIISWLLRNKDAKQEEEIKRIDAEQTRVTERLRILELKLAENHYPKSEIKELFDGVKAEIEKLGVRIETYNDTILKHIVDRRSV